MSILEVTVREEIKKNGANHFKKRIILMVVAEQDLSSFPNENFVPEQRFFRWMKSSSLKRKTERARTLMDNQPLTKKDEIENFISDLVHNLQENLSTSRVHNPMSEMLDKEIKDVEKNKDLEKEIEDDKENKDNFDDLVISYGFNEEKFFLAKRFYDSSPLDYTQLFYGENKQKSSTFESDDVYWTEAVINDVKTDVLTTQEAEKEFFSIQYSSAAQMWTSVNQEQKRRFDMWIKENPAMFKVFEALYSVCREMDYAPLR